MVHAALLLLMLEAVHTDLVFTISLKRSTQDLQLSTSSPADYPIFSVKSGHRPNRRLPNYSAKRTTTHLLYAGPNGVGDVYGKCVVLRCVL